MTAVVRFALCKWRNGADGADDADGANGADGGNLHANTPHARPHAHQTPPRDLWCGCGDLGWLWGLIKALKSAPSGPAALNEADGAYGAYGADRADSGGCGPQGAQTPPTHDLQPGQYQWTFHVQ